MIVIPAIDIKGGRCVRLKQGRREDETVFSDDPVRMAREWVEKGARFLHVVDLDGAFEKRPVHHVLIQRMVQHVPVPVQVGGGIRDAQGVRLYLDMGVERVILGTRALSDPAFVEEVAARYPGRIAVGIDAKAGRVAVEGWTQTTRMQAVDLAKRFDSMGIGAIIFTDIHRDGMQTGPNIAETRRLAAAVSTPVIASGGVSCLDDIRNLLSLEEVGVQGVITGKALYSKSLDLSEAIRIAGRGQRTQ